MKTQIILLFISCIVFTASASALLEETVAHSRALKQDPTPEEIEKARADDRAVWDNADHGEKRRALKATSAVDAATHSRALKQDPTPEEIEKARSDDRAVWDNADHGGEKRKRALKATYGNAYGSVTIVSTPTSSSLKVQPNGYDCLITSSSTGTADCSRNLAYVVPACCSSSSESSSTKCQSWDNAQNIVCSASATPYPACCTFRDQPAVACNVYNSNVQCGTSKPGVGCCRSGSCSLNDDGSGGTCSSGASVGCCPA